MNRETWNAIVESFPRPQFLQTWEWAETKKQNGWEKDLKVWKDDQGEIIAAAMILIRSVEFFRGLLKFKIAYIPRGPMFRTLDKEIIQRVLSDIQDWANSNHLIFIKIDPEVVTFEGEPGQPDEKQDKMGAVFLDSLQDNGWQFSPDQIQYRNTVLIDLRRSEEEMLAAMKQKARYNIRLAGRKGVEVRTATPEDFELLYEMYLETSTRDGFIIRSKDYYLELWERFYQQKMATALIAEVEDESVAGIVLFHVGDRAWYFYGMSTNKHKKKMPNYLLQWEAMRIAKAQGCTWYDLWGAPDEFNEKDGLWGVYRFKRGLGGLVQRTVGAWDYTQRKGMYFMYQRVIPSILALLRRSRKKEMADEVDRTS